MSIRFTPLPITVFGNSAAPYIARLNKQLVDLFALEGSLTEPAITQRSDFSIARKETETVHITRISPDISAVVAGASTVIGIPALTFGTTNTIGTTRTVVSIDSAIQTFDATVPVAIALDGAGSVGTAGLMSRNDHVHGLTAASPSGGYSTASSEGSAASTIRSDAIFRFPSTLLSDANDSTLVLADDGTSQSITGSLGILTISPSTTLAIDAKTEITEAGSLDCLSLVQGTGEGSHLFLDDKGGNPTEPVAPGNMWRFANTWKIRAQAFQFGEDNASSTTRVLGWVNRMGGAIKAHSLQWFKNGFSANWANATRTLDLPDGDTTETIVNATAGSPSLGKPEGGIIYDGQDGQHAQTMANKRFVDASTFFRNDTNAHRGFRFQVGDLADPVGSSTIDNSHGVVNIPATISLNPNQSDMILHDVANNFTDNNTFNEWIDIVGITTLAANPAAGTRRLHVDKTSGEISVRTSSGTLVSLEAAAAAGSTSAQTLYTRAYVPAGDTVVVPDRNQVVVCDKYEVEATGLLELEVGSMLHVIGVRA